MATMRITSLRPAPTEGWYKCVMCGFDLNVKKGQLVPPCPKCSAREFEESSGPPQCA
jgi:hypothetical protein